jgi:hypothetical protein
MSTFTLTLLDTVGIQGYIFNSNVLREHIGASELVRRATGIWPLEVARERWKTNVNPGKLTGTADDLNGELHIDKSDAALDVEVLYAAGGNCALLFREAPDARAFITELSRRVLENAPGLPVAVVHVDGVAWDEQEGLSLAAAMEQAQNRMVTKKLDRRMSMPLLGVGVTAACQSTGLPAVGTDGDEPGMKPDDAATRLLSSEILAKLRVWQDAGRRMGDIFPQFHDARLEIPYDFDHFGRQEGDVSYIAVVHADASRMSERLLALREKYPTIGENRDYVKALRAFSRGVDGAATAALQDTVDRLLRHWRPLRDVFIGQAHNPDRDETHPRWQELEDVGEIKLAESKAGRFYAPFRPIVFGGDDLTFVTDGRLGLGLAAAYLEAFEQGVGEQESPDVAGLQACAGVAVVKVHYPFSRAYALAENLCDNAKDELKREVSALDWHFAATGLFGDIDRLRHGQYATASGGHLEMRPVSIHDRPATWRSWPRFVQVTKTFQIGQDWKKRRNKVLALRAALRQGEGAVEQFVTAYELESLPVLDQSTPSLQRYGWHANRCGYFDTIEALDFFVPLEG